MNDTQPTVAGVSMAVRNLRKSLGGQPVLKGLSFEVRRGERFVIMGPSGSGKTVLLKHLIGLEVPDEGEVLIEGLSIQSPEVMDKYRLAMVFQSGALLNSLTVGENVGLYLAEHRLRPPAEIKRIVTQKLAVVGLEGVEEKLPSELSGGMKKRVAIARALVIDPHIVFYDEPTSELDPVMAVTVGQEIVTLNQETGATSIMVTHDRDLAFGIADRIAIILGGELRCVGTPPEVRACGDAKVQEFLNIDFSFKTKSSDRPNGRRA